MAGFQIGMTNRGMELLTKGLSGSEIRFTGIQMGDGAYTGEIAAAESLLSRKAELPVSRLIRKSGQVTIKGVLKFGQVQQGFTWRELGLMARDPDGGADVLYAYGVSGSQGDYIPGALEATLDERSIQLTVLVAGAAHVTAVLDPTELYVRPEEMSEAVEAAVAPLRLAVTQTLIHQKAGRVHQLTGLGGRNGLAACQFQAAGGFDKGDSFAVDGTAYTGRSQDGAELGNGLFAAGAAVAVLLDTAGKTINFKPAGGGVSPFPAGTRALCRGFRQTTTWTVPFSGKYRFICIGRGGSGSVARYTSGQAQPSVSAGGGGSGAWCEKTMDLTIGEVFSIKVTIPQSQVLRGSEVILTATRGANGTSALTSQAGKGGAGGTATGGDTNHNGIAGTAGAMGAANTAVPGGDGAPVTDSAQLALYLNSSYGLGGLSGSNTGVNGTSPIAPELFPLTFGGGGGGGGVSAANAAGSGASGAAGCVIVEHVLG